MGIKDIEIFLAVYDYKSMSQAAKALFLTPQGVSNTIAKLEAEFNVTLFNRTIGGSQPTNDAILLKAHAQKLLDDFKRLPTLFSGTEINKKTIKVASIPGVFRYLTVDFITTFQKENPSYRLEIIEQHESIVDELCWNESVDIAINSCLVNHQKFDAYQLFDLNYCVIVNECSSLATKEQIAFTDLKDQPIAIIRCFDHYIASHYQQLNFTPNILVKTSDWDFLVDIADSNAGVSISIDYYADHHPRKYSVIRPFADNSYTYACHLLSKKNKPLSPEAVLFRDFTIRWQQTHNFL